jgi:transcriptional adapter 2-alpha
MDQEGNYIPTGGKKSSSFCSYCKRDITQQLRIQCAVCDHFDLCGDCFAAGVSRYPHVNTHDYRVVDCIDIPIFTRDWTASEELLMLEGIDKSGCGNLKNISDYIGTKTLKQVEEHYWELYMGVHGYCLPSSTIVNEESVLTETMISCSR